MRIVIDTDGNSSDTYIQLNGRVINTLKEFNFSVRTGKKVKLQMVREIDGQDEFLSYYGEDFSKFPDVAKKES